MTSSRSPLSAGVDGCRSGWVVVRVSDGAGRPRPRLIAVEVVEAIAPVLDEVRAGRLDVLAVDMPMGLPPSGPRRADDEARQRLGPRRSTVFPTPPRPLLQATDHADAVRKGRALDGRGISIQGFNLFPKIIELDGALTPDLYDRVIEAHPESGFATLAGRPLDTSKRTAEGRAQRRQLLTTWLDDPDGLLDERHRGAAPDDVLDAAVNAWTARRWRDGTAVVLGDGTRDERGIPLRIII